MSIWKSKVAHELGRRNGRWKGRDLWGWKAAAGLAKKMMGEIVVWCKGPGEVCRVWAGVCVGLLHQEGACGAFCCERINGSIPKGERAGKSHAWLWADMETSAQELNTHLPPWATTRGNSEVPCHRSTPAVLHWDTRNEEPLWQGISFGFCGNIRCSSKQVYSSWHRYAIPKRELQSHNILYREERINVLIDIK